MNSKECEEQLESLVEAWQLNEADLNQTDIEAIKHLMLENQMQHNEINKLKHILDEKEKLIDTILTFNLFGEECPLNFGFEKDSLQEKAQSSFYEDDGEYCENNCNDCYKKCWLRFFNKIKELRGRENE